MEGVGLGVEALVGERRRRGGGRPLLMRRASLKEVWSTGRRLRALPWRERVHRRGGSRRRPCCSLYHRKPRMTTSKDYSEAYAVQRRNYQPRPTVPIQLLFASSISFC